MTIREIEDIYNKCRDNPYLVATKFMGVKTNLTEREFNEQFEFYSTHIPIKSRSGYKWIKYDKSRV